MNVMDRLAQAVAWLRQPLSISGFRRLAAVAVFLLGLIVVTGAAVRLTGSGLGCPTWPKCGDGSLVTRSEYAGHGLIEFGNRLVSSAVSVVVAIVAVASFRLAERRRDLQWLSLGLVAGIIGQIVLGGFTVLFHLNPGLVAAHFLLSMLLLLDAVVLHHRTSVRGEGAPQALRWLGWGLTAVAAIELIVGTVVTGSGPHSGDSTHVARFSLNIRQVAQLHADIAMLLVGLVVATAVAVRAVPTSLAVRRETLAVVVLVIAQAVVGFVQYALGIPEGLVAVHVAGATALWVYTLRLALALQSEPLTVSSAVPEQIVLPEREPMATAVSRPTT
jgi:cytochrome c oxidase assembly protein subunit 15